MKGLMDKATGQEGKAHVTYNSSLFDIGLVKITGSHVHCKRGNVLETVHDGVVVTADHTLKVIYGLSNSGNSDHLE